MLVSRDIGISGGCVGGLQRPHDVTPDHPARARVAEGEDGDGRAGALARLLDGDAGGVIVIKRKFDTRGELSAWLANASYATCVFEIGGDIDAMDLPVSFRLPWLMAQFICREGMTI